MQIEFINYNPIQKILDFIKTLSKSYIYVKYNDQESLSIEEAIDLIKNTLKKKPTIDIFLMKK